MENINSHTPISIIITVHDEADELCRNLPLWLSQEYDGDFEVIVVIEQGKNETEDVIKRFADNEHLYSTYIPQSSRYMSRKKLSITLGVKAAKNEWLVITEPTVRPMSNQWLKSFAEYCNDDNALVMGHTLYATDASSYKQYEHLRTATYAQRRAKRGKPFRTNIPLIALRKNNFMAQHGFRDNQKYLRGEYDFLVNQYGRNGKTAVADAPETWCEESAPTKKQWSNKHIFYQETRKHLPGKFTYSFLFNAKQFFIHMLVLLSIAAIAVGAVAKEWILMGAGCLALILYCIVSSIVISKKLAKYDVDIKAWMIPFYEISTVWRNLWWKIRHMKADKYDFISHKI